MEFVDICYHFSLIYIFPKMRLYIKYIIYIETYLQLLTEL